jgi:hypothetical protein
VAIFIIHVKNYFFLELNLGWHAKQLRTAALTSVLCFVKEEVFCFYRKFLFETNESEELGETNVLQNRAHPSQQKFFDLFGKHLLCKSIKLVLFICFRSMQVLAI